MSSFYFQIKSPILTISSMPLKEDVLSDISSSWDYRMKMYSRFISTSQQNKLNFKYNFANSGLFYGDTFRFEDFGSVRSLYGIQN